MKWGEGDWERAGMMGLSFRTGRGTGSQGPHTNAASRAGEKTSDYSPSGAGFADPAGREGAMCAHTPVYYTHTYVPAFELQARAVCREPHVPGAGALPSEITHTHAHAHTHTHTHTHMRPFPSPRAGRHCRSAQSQQAQRVAETECIRFNSLELIAP